MDFDIQVGFNRVDITPPLGVFVRGYLIDRYASGVLDKLELTCLAVKKDNKLALIFSVDNIGIRKEYADLVKDLLVKELQVERAGIFIHATHTHTSSEMGIDEVCKTELDKAYSRYSIYKFVEAAKLAIDDLTNAKMGYAVSKAENVAFNRRYLMKDDSYRTNPGVNNPEIVKSAGLVDERVNVVRFVRSDGKNIVLANFGNHPDTIGGTEISADWPGFTRRIFEKAIDNAKCIFINGAQGDINHVNVHPKSGDLNGMIYDFDDVTRGYSHARHIGNVVAGAIMSVYEKVNFVDVDSIDYRQQNFLLASNKPKKEEMPEARRILEIHAQKKDKELPYKGMMLTTIIADAKRKVKLENAPDYFELLFSAVRIGKIALFGIPGEPFCGIGIGIKETKGYDMVLPCCSVNGYISYFPMKDSFDEGGYESMSSDFKSGVAESIICQGKHMLEEMKE